MNPIDWGQQGDDYFVGSFNPNRFIFWTEKWIVKLRSADEKEREQLLPYTHKYTNYVLDVAQSLAHDAVEGTIVRDAARHALQTVK